MHRFIFNKIKKNRHIVIFLFITIIMSIPLFYGKFILLDDAHFHAERIYDLSQSMKNGVLRPYIYSTALKGYGYANPVFYPDLFLYIPALVNLIGVKLSTCYKIYIALSTLFTGIIAYYCFNKINNNNEKLSLIFSCIYMVFPYRLYDLYYRNAVGEVLFLIFLPILILGLFEIFNKNKWYSLCVACTCICYAHLLSFFMTIIFIGIVYILNIKKINKLIIINTIKATSISFLLCINLLLPMLEFFKSDKYLVNISSPFGSLSSNSIIILKNIEGNIYIPTIIFIVFCYILFIIYKRINKISATIHVFFISLSCFIISTNLFPWDLLSIIFPIFNKLQFPWRVNCFTTFFISLYLSLIVFKILEFFRHKDLKISLFFSYSLSTFLLIFFMSFTYYTYSTVEYQYDSDFIPYSIGMGEYLPVGFIGQFGSNYEDIQDLLVRVKERYVIINEAKYNSISTFIKGNKTIIEINNPIADECKIELPFTYYKGYEVYLNGVKINNTKSDNGLIQVDIKNISKCYFEITYKGTNIQKISLYVSLFTLIIFLIITIKRKYKI